MAQKYMLESSHPGHGFWEETLGGKSPRARAAGRALGAYHVHVILFAILVTNQLQILIAVEFKPLALHASASWGS